MLTSVLAESSHAHVELPIPAEGYAALAGALFAMLFLVTLAFSNVGKSPE